MSVTQADLYEMSAAFHGRMLRELHANEHKDGTLEGTTVLDAVSSILYHSIKLLLAHEHGDNSSVAEYACDVANEAMIAAAIAGVNQQFDEAVNTEQVRGDRYGIAIMSQRRSYKDDLTGFVRWQLNMLRNLRIPLRPRDLT